MAILTRQFHAHEDGSHYETFHYLARDTDTDAVYVVCETIDPRGRTSERKIKLAEFLGGDDNTAQRKLRELIGALVPDEKHAKKA